jgi:energy-coupling factor transporter ATP-binding protein EcfA2
MRLHPFSEDRFAGTITGVEGSFVTVALPSAGGLARSTLGQRLGKGEVGEFLIVEVGGLAVFGRLIDVAWGRASTRTPIDSPDRIAEGRMQLLSTISPHGVQRGVEQYPRLGDRVFVAGDEVIKTVIAVGSNGNEVQDVSMGHLSVGDQIEVRVPVQKLFGRHLAVVGATGSGKSWTLAHLVESVRQKHGKMVLIDATGEFHTLKESVRHLALGNLDEEPSATLVTLPHWLMREQDRNAFITPSSGSQVPKLRAAIRSLRLVELLRRAGWTGRVPLVQENGLLIKANMPREDYDKAMAHFSREIEDPHSVFSLPLLARQVLNECLWPPKGGGTSHFGDTNQNDQGYVSSLVSRIEDLVQTPEIMNVISGQDDHKQLMDEIEKWLADGDDSILRISLRNLTFSHSLREIVVNIVGHRLLKDARAGSFKNRPLVVALDEAHQFFNVTIGDDVSSAKLDAFDLIAKEGRKYGLTVCMATQRPGDLPTGVLSQVGMMIVHRLADGRDRQRVEEAAAEIDLSATRLLPGLVPGEALFMGVDFPVPVSVRVTKPATPPESAGPKFSTGWTPAPQSPSEPEMEEKPRISGTLAATPAA